MAAFMFLCCAGCGIEGYQPVNTLSSPLGLTAVETNSQILLQFWGENDESFFSGYYIYMAETINDLEGSNAMVLLNSDGRAGKPTIYNVVPSTSAQQFSFTVTHYTNNSSLQSGTTYYFFVKAYSGEYNIYSDPGNITNVAFQ